MGSASTSNSVNLAGQEDPEFTMLKEYLVEVHDPSIMCTTAEMTEILISRAAKFFADHGYDVKREAVVGEFGRLTGSGAVRRRKGRLDLLVQRPGGPLAVEVDRTSKGSSLKKLRYAKANGCDVLWIRWDPDQVPGRQDRFSDEVPTIGLRVLFIASEKDVISRPRPKPKAVSARNLTKRQLDPRSLPQNASEERQAELERRREQRHGRGVTNGTRKNAPGKKPIRRERGGMEYRSPVRMHDLPCPTCGQTDCGGLWHDGDRPGDRES